MLRPVIDALPGARLAIVGDGPGRGILERQFAGTPTVFTGYLRGDELAHAYASADIFVLTGANETFGNVVLEAMASGLPVIVPDTGGQIDHVAEGVNGLVYAADDSDALVAAACRLASDLPARAPPGRCGPCLRGKTTMGSRVGRAAAGLAVARAAITVGDGGLRRRRHGTS